jgi:hypothetical protein
MQTSSKFAFWKWFILCIGILLLADILGSYVNTYMIPILIGVSIGIYSSVAISKRVKVHPFFQFLFQLGYSILVGGTASALLWGLCQIAVIGFCTPNQLRAITFANFSSILLPVVAFNILVLASYIVRLLGISNRYQRH